MVSREGEQFREDLSRSMWNTEDIHTLNPRLLARNVDSEAVNKCRIRTYRQNERTINRMTERSGDYDEMERARASKGDYAIDCREFHLGENIATRYFDYYGHGITGLPIIDNPDDGYICPHCGLKYKMSLKLVPEYCKRCDHLTFMGEMIRDRVFRR